MRNVLTRFACVCTVTLLMNFGQSRAGVIVTNLSEPVGGVTNVYTSTGGLPREVAQEFTTGSQSVTLMDVIASLGGGSGTFTASAELLADNGSNSPSSTVLTSFTVPSIPTGTSYSNLTFTPTTSDVVLSANTSYWFALAASGTGTGYKWQYTDTTNSLLPNYAFSTDGGATWAQIILEGPGPSSSRSMAPRSPPGQCGPRAFFGSPDRTGRSGRCRCHAPPLRVDRPNQVVT